MIARRTAEREIANVRGGGPVTRPGLRALAVCLAVIASSWPMPRSAAAGPSVVVKIAEDFEGTSWPVNPWNKASGKSGLVDGPTGKCMEVEIDFSGRGFEWFVLNPSEPLRIPGETKRVRLRYKRSDANYPLIVNFKDGWGRGQVGDRKLEWHPPLAEAADWRESTFDVPGDWVQPISIDGLSSHNWSAQNTQATARFWIDELRVETDISQVDPATGLLRTWRANPDEKDPAKREPPRTPLVQVRLSTGRPANVFAGEEPRLAIELRNWKPGTLSGEATCRVLDRELRPCAQERIALSVESASRLALPLRAGRFGLYTLQATLTLSDGTRREESLAFALVPAPARLSAEEKKRSPYGVNVHGGKDAAATVIRAFAAAGAVWFRDYAWNYEWLLRAKGEDRRYAGWPNYPALVRKYEDAGAMLLPCLAKAIKPPKVRDGKVDGPVGPDRVWASEIADIVRAFPQVTAWELDNEYDLDRQASQAEEAVGWRNYRAYHKRFAEVLGVFGGGELLAVEQGRAGIWPERARQCVESGDFAGIGVVNSHHYCGVDAPETNYGNFNTGFDGKSPDEGPKLFFDRLREAARAASADGRRRESWLTEFGWDTLAGNVVTPFEQAAYLARGWMVAMAAGTDKCFWFFDQDSATPDHFFDGCGLLTHDMQPKLSLCALAGLASTLPNPRYVGSINAGGGTQGYVFESGGSLVAALWTVEAETGPKATFREGSLRDFLGNPLQGRSAQLARAPLYVSGLGRTDPFYAQTAYEIESPHMIVAAAGDEVVPEISVRGNRQAAIRCTVRMVLPEGWSAPALEAAGSVEPGGATALRMPFTVAPGERLGLRHVRFECLEGRSKVKEMQLAVFVEPPVALRVGPLEGPPGKAKVSVKVANRSKRAAGGSLRASLPASWRLLGGEARLEGLGPRELRELALELEWRPASPADRPAEAVFEGDDGRSARGSIIPNEHRIGRARGIVIDGRLDDWPAGSEFPGWLLGSTMGEPGARVFLAWSEEGIWGALEVRDSKLSVADPRSFWNGDCLELFVDTSADKRHRFFEPGDHQFWLVPLVAENRAYLGQWKCKEEIDSTRYDIREARSAARRLADGYAMEFLLPASLLKKYRPAVGARLGLNLNLTVRGARFAREVYWPRPKEWVVQNLPKTWGTVTLVE